jgi:regulatory protein
MEQQRTRELAEAARLAPVGAPGRAHEPEPTREPESARGPEPEDARRSAEARELEAALVRCHHHLARREHSFAQLRARLERERLPPRAITEALATVAHQGYLDDARFARLLIEDRRGVDGWGAARIRAQLEAAGIARELIDELTAGFDAGSEREAAVALIRRRWELPLADDRQRRRAFGVLVQRGFDADVAYDAIDACGASSDEAARDP